MPQGAAFAVAPIAATFLALLQRPVKIAQIRDDAFAPEWEWKGVAGRGEGGGECKAGGKRMDEHRWLSVHSTCSTAPHAGVQPISDSNSGLGPVEPLRSMACPHTHTRQLQLQLVMCVEQSIPQ